MSEIWFTLTEIFTYGLIFLLPIGSVLWFVISLVRFLCCPAQEEIKRKRLRFWLIVSGIAAFILGGGLLALIVIFAISIAHM